MTSQSHAPKEVNQGLPAEHDRELMYLREVFENWERGYLRLATWGGRGSGWRAVRGCARPGISMR